MNNLLTTNNDIIARTSQRNYIMKKLHYCTKFTLFFTQSQYIFLQIVQQPIMDDEINNAIQTNI